MTKKDEENSEKNILFSFSARKILTDKVRDLCHIAV